MNPSLFLFKNNDHSFIKNIMKNINYNPNDDIKDLSKSDSISSQNLQAMQLIAKMREAADRVGAGFVGGFITPTGEKFVSSNLQSDDEQFEVINNRINDVAMKIISIQEEND